MAEPRAVEPTLRAVGADGAYRAPASQEQARLWLLAAERPTDRSYHMAYSIALRGSLDPDRVAGAIAGCVARHDAFRTVFGAGAGGVWQIIEPTSRLALDVLDLSGLPLETRAAVAEAEERAVAGLPFSLTTGPLVRFRLLRLGERDHRLVVAMHHIVGDGWSHAVIVRDFCALYSESRIGRPLESSDAAPLQYVDYAIWQQQARAAGDFEAAVRYWLARIEGLSARPRLPFAGSVPPGSPAAHRLLALGPALEEALHRYRIHRAVPLSAVFLAIYSGALATLADEHDFLLGIITANRSEDTANTVGFFANTVAVPAPTAPDLSFDDLVDRSVETLADVQAYGTAPFEEVVARGGLANAAAGGPPLTALLVVQNAPEPSFAIPNIDITVSRVRVGGAKFPITLFVTESPDALTVELEYAPDHMSSGDADVLADRMHDILARGLADGARPALDPAPCRAGTESILRGEMRPDWLAHTVLERIAHRAAVTPDAIAVVHPRGDLRYSDLGRHIDAFAARLRAAGLVPGGVVAVSLPRSAELLVAILAIMRAEGAWCPIDPDLPMTYKSALIASARPALAIATSGLSDLVHLPPPDLAVVPIVPTAPPPLPDLDRACYVIHTSGTTGAPKGVIVPHRALANVTAWIADTLVLRPGDRTVWKTPIGFDAVCRELFPILIAGGTLRVAPPGIEGDMRALGCLLHEVQVTTFHCVPSQLAQLVELDSFPPSLRAIMCGGEALSAALARRVLAAGPRLLNVYGPTEATVDCAAYEAGGDEPDGVLPLGRPIANTMLSIVRKGRVQARPSIGVLRVTGSGVALGYTDADESAFGADAEGRWYETGDRGHLRHDGVVVFHGRDDRQLKLRGVRIESGAIEAALRTEPGIDDAHVECVEETGLVAFITPDMHATPERPVPRLGCVGENWRAVFDAVYETIDPSVPPALNTHGWIDSAVRLPLPRAEVLRAVESAAERILTWRPRRILEIGSGVWTLGACLASACEIYHGIDFSEAAVAYSRAHAEATGLRHATLELAAMADFDPRGERFDAIVLNSVIQYLPDRETLEAVLARLVGALAEGGFLFVGDVRNVALDALVSLWRVRMRRRGDEPCDALAIEVEVDRLNDPELRLHPGFFTSFAERNGFAPPLIETKTAAGTSEMARFRYDVTLTRDRGKGARLAPRPPIETRRNAWLAGEARLLRALHAAPAATRLDAIAEAIGEVSQTETAFLDVGADQHVVARPGADPLDIDLVAIAPDADLLTACHEAGYRWPEPPGDSDLVVWRRFIAHAATIRETLAARLPAQAIPNRVVPLPRLPTLPNGKRAHVTFRRLARDQLREMVRAPAAGSLEETVAQAFEEVLGRRFGLDDDFFALGGHSLLATQARARLEDRLARSIPLRLLFDAPTPAALAAVLLAQGPTQFGVRAAILPRADPATAEVGFAQRRLWFIERLGTAEGVYSVAHAVRLRGPLDRAALVGAVADLFGRHAPLRTVFPERDGEPIAIVCPPGEAPIEDLARLPSLQAAVEALVAARAQPFDLARAPLARVLLCTLGEEDHLLGLVAHHIVCDGWSMLVATRDLAALYAARRDSSSPKPPPLRIDYYDLVASERERERRGAYELGLAFWAETLRDVPPILQLPHDKTPPARRTWRGEKIAFALSPLQIALLRAHARCTGATLFMVLLTVYAALLHRLSEQDDIVVGTVIANRDRVETEPLVGFLVNALAIRSRLAESATFASHAAAMREAVVTASEHQDVPFELLVERLATDRRSDYQAVFQVLFAMQTTPREDLRLGEAVAERVRLPPTGAMFDLSLEMWDDTDGIRGELEYATDLFHPHTAIRIVERFRTLVEELLARPYNPIRAAPLLPAQERDTLARFARGPALEVPEADTPLARVMAHARSHPDVVAMEGIGLPLAYGALAERIEALAGAMACAGVRAGDRVGLLLTRGSIVAIGYFAAHRLGAVPVYFDPTHPPARRDLLARAVLLGWCVCAPEDTPPRVSGLRTIRIREGAWEELCPLPTRVEPRDPAYATFTSGTTGAPKIVQVTQAALAARLVANDRLFGTLAPGTRFAHCYTFNYDGGLSSLFWPITRGGTIVFLPLDVLGDGASLARRLADARITVLDAIPAVLASLYERWPSEGLPDLALVVTGGDVCPPELAARHFERCRARFANQYGPCEAVINATTAVYDRAPERMTIGRPIAGVDVLVLDRSCSLAPLGAHGEIVIGGAHLADGYLDDPTETAERFPLLDPEGTGPRRWYRSGDRGRWLDTGELEFLGRVDRQVQINGMRVELCEVESALTRFQGVESCHGFVNGRGVLCAGVVPGSQMTVDASAHSAAWAELFDGIYGDASPAYRNYAGWAETATGENLPREQMDVWLDAILAVLRRRPAGRVLEIGSGLGLVALELAAHATRYVAIDSSAVAVARLAEEARRRGLDNLEVRRLDVVYATDADLGGPFDLIVVNSVLQYLPDAATARTLVSRLLGRLSLEGRLFVGDVRDYRLRERFWQDVIGKRTGGDPREEETRRLVAEARTNDEELHLAPEFFLEIAEAACLAQPPSILIKHGFLDNELSNYRFDVLYDRAAQRPAPAEETIQIAGADDLASLTWRLRAARRSVRLIGVPSRRLVGTGVDPSDVLALAHRLGVELILLASPDPWSFDAVLMHGRDGAATLPPARFPPTFDRAPRANDPLLGMRGRAHREALVRHAAAQLPAHMVPARLLFLDRLPIRPGGKIDEEALRQLDPACEIGSCPRAQGDLAFAVMCDLWEELLGSGPFGRDADFFERGGHSLMAARLAAAIRREFGVPLPVIRVFELRRLGDLVDEVTRLAGGAEGSGAEGAEGPHSSTSCAANLPSPTQAAILRAVARTAGAPSHIGLAIELRRPISAAALEDAVRRACRRHPLLARRFDHNGRVIADTATATLAYSSLGASDVLAEISAPLDLKRDGPLALTAFGERARATHVVVRAHPFAFDRDSLLILLRDVAEALRRDELPTAPDYAMWAEREQVIAAAGSRSREVEGSSAAAVGPVRWLERRWGAAWERGLGALAADLGVTPAAVLLGGFAAAFTSETGGERVVIGCAASLRPFLPEPWRDDMIGPLTVDVPLVFDEPAQNLAEGALAAAGKITELFRAPGAGVLGRDPPVITFSYREAAPPLSRLWPAAGAVRHVISPLWSRVKLSISRDAEGLQARLSYDVGTLNEDSARRLLKELIPPVEAPRA
jgi:pristinamycin I synthase-3/4